MKRDTSAVEAAWDGGEENSLIKAVLQGAPWAMSVAWTAASAANAFAPHSGKLLILRRANERIKPNEQRDAHKAVYATPTCHPCFRACAPLLARSGFEVGGAYQAVYVWENDWFGQLHAAVQLVTRIGPSWNDAIEQMHACAWSSVRSFFITSYVTLKHIIDEVAYLSCIIEQTCRQQCVFCFTACNKQYAHNNAKDAFVEPDRAWAPTDCVTKVNNINPMECKKIRYVLDDNADGSGSYEDEWRLMTRRMFAMPTLGDARKVGLDRRNVARW